MVGLLIDWWDVVQVEGSMKVLVSTHWAKQAGRFEVRHSFSEQALTVL